MHTLSDSHLNDTEVLGHTTVDQPTNDIPDYHYNITHISILSNALGIPTQEHETNKIKEPDMYEYTEDLTKLEGYRTEISLKLPSEAASITTPLKHAAWEEALANHKDKKFVEYILKGIGQGFHIGFNGSAVGAKKNMRSAVTNPTPVDEYLQEELENNRSHHQ